MQNSDGEKFRRVVTPSGPAAPSPWVTRFAGSIPEKGPILDLACGKGRHSKYFLDLGHPVTAIDQDIGGLGDLRDRPGLGAIEADLEYGPWPLEGRTFAAVVVVNYLHRPLFPRIAQAVGSGGIVIYETFAEGNERFGRPARPDFLLKPRELLGAFGDDFAVIAYQHGQVRVGDGFAIKQYICALRGEADRFPLPTP